ncbi:TPM domain-containing protein [Patescibacteria group bacterium]
MKKILTTVFIAVVSFTVVIGLVHAKTYPAPTGYVNDFASVISSDTKQELETNLTQFEADTDYQVSVVTLTSLEEDVIENVAVDLFEQWGIGQKDKDNGVLLLIAVDDRAMRIEVGYGAEAVLTDSRSGNIIRTVIAPEFKQDDYDAGISKGVEAIKQVLVKDPTLFDAQTTESTTDEDPFGAFIFGAIILIYISAFFAKSKRFWPGGVVGAFIGFIFSAITGAILLGLFGLFLDYVLSKNYKKRKAKGLPTGFFSSRGGFSSGRSSGSSFGGFGGGSSGGGGASGGW